MMRKGLFNFIKIAKGAHDFVYMSVRITNDVIRKGGGGQGDESKRVGENSGGARVE